MFSLIIRKLWSGTSGGSVLDGCGVQADKCSHMVGDSFTVYSAELYGIYLATEKTLELSHSSPKIRIICVDNQSALRAVAAPGNRSRQHILQRIVHGIENLRLYGFTVELHWVPAHTDIKGNEHADKLAKEATGWRLKRLRRGKTREENTTSTAPQAQHVKELLSAKKTQLV